MRRDDTTVALANFGIAKSLLSDDRMAVTQTRHGDVVGTPRCRNCRASMRLQPVLDRLMAKSLRNRFPGCAGVPLPGCAGVPARAGAAPTLAHAAGLTEPPRPRGLGLAPRIAG